MGTLPSRHNNGLRRSSRHTLGPQSNHSWYQLGHRQASRSPANCMVPRTYLLSLLRSRTPRLHTAAFLKSIPIRKRILN
ncbi:hypothetical protein E2C01_074591 [Portunus trituberculatus]|uniref:Uncharacterized protein n=1 Tax=Portunus trituberculatus TaxID=210409 RepID=A0A5B7IGP3_PORTR|nr:hypothetical protein [Portunus trituberculatus]